MLRREMKALLRRLVLPSSGSGDIRLRRRDGGVQDPRHRPVGMAGLLLHDIHHHGRRWGMERCCRVWATGPTSFSALLMWVSMGAMVYATAVVTAFIVEEHLGQFFVTRRAIKVISQMKDHYILVGAGRAGFYALGELGPRPARNAWWLRKTHPPATAYERASRTYRSWRRMFCTRDSLLLAGVETGPGA